MTIKELKAMLNDSELNDEQEVWVDTSEYTLHIKDAYIDPDGDFVIATED